MLIRKNLCALLATALVASASLHSTTARASDLDPYGILTASNAQPNDFFAASVATSGGRALVGSVNAGTSGTVYAFEYDGTDWIEVQQLTSSDDMGRFGAAVAMDGDLALVGASESAQAYAFRHNGTAWVETQILTAPAGQSFWGARVAMLGERALITGANTVTGYRYDGSSWVIENALVPAAPTGNLGVGLAMFGDKAVLGDPDIDFATGGAWVFRHDGSGWVEEQQLITVDSMQFFGFGVAVALGPDMAIVGAFGDQSVTGAAYAFRFDGSAWIETQKLTASDGQPSDRFGEDVVMDGSSLTIGAISADAGAGSAYEYRFDGTSWTEVQKISAPAGASDFFGRPMSYSDGLLLVGVTQAVNGEGRVSTYFRDACLTGSINSANAAIVDVLYVEGSNGGEDRQVEVSDGSFFTVSMLRPPMGGNGRFVLHANLGTADPSTIAPLPFDVGTTCFPFLLNAGASPVIIANSLGKTNLVGSSQFFGTPADDPDRAEIDFRIYALPTGTTLTLQAIEIDPGSVSQKNASTTNGVVVQVQ